VFTLEYRCSSRFLRATLLGEAPRLAPRGAVKGISGARTQVAGARTAPVELETAAPERRIDLMRNDNLLIYADPFHSPLEIFGDVVFALGPGCTKYGVTLIVSPNIQHYAEKAASDGVQRRQETSMIADADSQRLRFHMDDPNRTADIKVDGRAVRVTFLGAGETFLNMDTGELCKSTDDKRGQWFSHYGFDIECHDVPAAEG
jgi:hypothetical protein